MIWTHRVKRLRNARNAKSQDVIKKYGDLTLVQLKLSKYFIIILAHDLVSLEFNICFVLFCTLSTKQTILVEKQLHQ